MVALALMLAAGSTSAIAQSDSPVAPQPPVKIESLDDNKAESKSAPQAVEPAELPEVSDSVTALLDQVYLKDDERAALRIKHGLWEAADIANIASKAHVALAQGDFMNPALDDIGADILDRAESQLRRGEPAKAIELIASNSSLRALRLLANAQLDLGQRRDAEKTLQKVVDTLRAGMPDNADEVAQGVRGLILLARLRGAEGKDSVGYQSQLSMLGQAGDTLDRLSWQVKLAEAELLYEKDEYEQAGPAVTEALSLNPRSADAWLLLGRIWVDALEFDRAEGIAARLDQLASELTAAAEAPAQVKEAEDNEAKPDEHKNPAKQSVSPPPSLYGSTIRALLRMRQVEGALALEEIKPALESYPKSRELLALRAAATALSFDFSKADSFLSELDALTPDSPEGYFLAGKAMASSRQYEEAAKYLRKANERAPGWAEPLFELGLSELQAGNLAQSRDALQNGLALDRFNVRASNSVSLLKELDTYVSVESDHFIVRYKPGADEVMAKEMLPTLERIFARVTGNATGGIRHAPKGKTVVELYPNHRWFATRISGMPALHTFAAATGPVIAMETPREGPGHLVGPYDWARVVQHEYTHTVTLSRTKNRLPHWFTEAGAVYLEDAPVDYNVVRLLTQAWRTESFFDFDTINVMFAKPRKPTDRTQAYMQGAWMYAYIIEKFGEDAPLALMDLYAAGVREEEAFQTVLKVSRADFLSQFSLWFADKLRAWGMIPKDDQSSLDEFIEKAKVEEPTQALLDEWNKEQPGNPFVLERLVGLAAQRNEGLNANDIPLLEAYAAARPVDPMPHKLMAKLYLSGEDGLSPNDAIPHLEYVDAREQNSTAYASELAKLYADKQDWTRAIAKITRATQISPYDGKIREQAATIALRAGDFKTAEQHIWALTMIEPDREVHKKRLEAVRAKLK
ncbi:MAG: hypothetical protein U0640_06190 [Phycisphaerales bacterium]